ncbi:MAG: hypothetical protein D6756_08155 [Cyanobacteria bacterium J083]|nr:MAG: hypothetical protein D6756_08155 [Cyanobacteria bacterium J083]
MAVSEQFKQALKAGKLQEAVALAISNAFELKITTKVVANTESSHNSDQTASKYCLKSSINLAAGEINNEIAEELIDSGLYQVIEQFHSQQVNRSQQTLQQNLNSLEKMLHSIASLQHYLPADFATKSLPTAIETEASIEEQTNQTLTEVKLKYIETNQQEEIILTEQESEQSFMDAEEDWDDEDDPLLSLADFEPEEEAAAEDWGDWLEEESLSAENPQNS